MAASGLHSEHHYAGSRWFLGLICFCVFWLLVALFEAEERSEKLMVEMTLRSMRIGLKAAMAEAMLHGREAEMAGWPGSNPMRWLGGMPENYRGECPEREIEAMPRRSWCFDKEAGELVYRPLLAWHLRWLGHDNPQGFLRWRVAGLANMPQPPVYLGVNLQLVTPYVWFGD